MCAGSVGDYYLGVISPGLIKSLLLVAHILMSDWMGRSLGGCSLQLIVLVNILATVEPVNRSCYSKLFNMPPS